MNQRTAYLVLIVAGLLGGWGIWSLLTQVEQWPYK